MSREGHVARRDALVGPIYNFRLATRLISKIITDDKRGVAQEILYNTFDIIEVRTNEKPMEVFERVLENAMPLLELKIRRTGGANYQVPMEISAERRLTPGLRWITNYTRLGSEKTMEQRLAARVMGIANGSSAPVKKREGTHKVAEANKAFVHYRW